VVRLLAKKWAQRVVMHAWRAALGGALAVLTMPDTPRIPADGPTFRLGRGYCDDWAAVLAGCYLHNRSLPAASIGPRFAVTKPTAACDEACTTGPGGPSVPGAHAGDASAQAGTSLRCPAVASIAASPAIARRRQSDRRLLRPVITDGTNGPQALGADCRW